MVEMIKIEYAKRKYIYYKHFRHYIKALKWWIKWKYYEVKSNDR